MTARTTRWTRLRAGGLASFAGLVALQACGVDSPVVLDDSDPVVQGAVAGPDGTVPAPVESVADVRAEPTFTPFTTAPSIANRDEVIAMMVKSYPPLLKDAGIGGTARVFFFINEQGIVEQVRLDQSSGHAALDDAALNVAGAYRFSPARNGDDAVPVWVSFPITFQVR